MTKRRSGAILTRLELNRESAVPVWRQLEDQLRRVILSRRLPAGARLPSSRVLSEDLGISRPTVVQVLERLEAEGLVEMRQGAGTFVAEALPLEVGPPAPADDGAPDPHPPRSSDLGARLLSLDADIEAREHRPFLPNTPAYDRFPIAIWQNCVIRQSRRAYRDNMGYAEPAGFEPLRRAIATYLALHRGDACEPEQVVITPGAHAAFMIAAQLLTNPGDGLLFEDPGPFIARHLFTSLGRRLVHVPVDDEGMDFEATAAADRQVRLAFVMPSRQHPLGRTLSLQRRLRLLEWGRENDAWILEDDYDSEFRYNGRPLPSMRSIDRGGRVVYVGTFSKALFPALRIGYFVLPPGLVDMFRNAMALVFRSMPLASQMALADFLDRGHFATHLRTMRDLYAERRSHFLAAVERAGGGLQAEIPDSGMNALVWLPPGVDDRSAARRAVAADVHCYPLSDYGVAPFRPGLILGFTGVSEGQLLPGLRRLADGIDARRSAADG